jgi:cytochrome c556
VVTARAGSARHLASGPARLALVFVVARLAGGCATPAEQRYEETLARTGPAAAHAVHAARLTELMRGLEQLTRERLPQALDLEAARERRMARVRRVARAVAASAEAIPAAAGDQEGQLDAAARADFENRAAALGESARALADDAPVLSSAALDARLAELREVCDGCHAGFRVPR